MALAPVTFPGGGQLRVFEADGTPLITIAPIGGGFAGGVFVAIRRIETCCL